MKIFHRLTSTLSTAATAVVLGVALLTARTASATPYASSITNSNGTIKFYLNEGGANVTVTYEDGSTNVNFDGLTQGTNTPAGQTNFLLGTHSSYKISVTKIGAGSPSEIGSVAIGTARGVDVNKNTASPYFGRIYEVNGGSGVVLLNPDLSPTFSGGPNSKAGVTTFGSGGTGTGQSPYRLSVAADDSVFVGDASEYGCAVYRIDPNFTTNQLVLGPVGLIPTTNGTTVTFAPQVSHGTIESRPITTGSLANGNLVLYTVDGELGPVYASIQVYDIGAGPLPWTNAPTYTGNDVGVGSLDSVALGGNEYPGLTMGTNGLIYASTYRAGNPSVPPLVQVYDHSGSNCLWNSWAPPGTAWQAGTGSATSDYFQLPINGVGAGAGIVDSAISLDGNYLVGETIDNGIIVCPVTNGIPNVANVFTVNPTSNTGNGRGLALDAADNFYVSSSGEGSVQEWSLGITATAITMGNAAGQTNYALVLPNNTVSVVAVTNFASQSGPAPGLFTITRTSATANYSSPIVVNFTLSGASVNGPSYTLSPPVTSSITIAAGMTSTNITVIPTAGGSRPTTSVTLTLVGGSAYSTAVPFFDTVSIQNTGPQVLQITTVQSPTVYKGLTNDPAYFVVTRYGDTNAPSYFPSGFVYGGTASAAEFVPAQPMEFDPGTITFTNFITPLIDTTNYVGNKTVTIALVAGSGFTVSNNVGTITILDNQYPPGNVIFSDSLTDPNDASNWEVASANDNMPAHSIDDTITFGYILTNDVNGDYADLGYISLPASGATNALRVTVNKTAAEGSGAAAGVNLYLTNLFLSGDYAVRFTMNLPEGDLSSYTTEGALFGINHTGNDTNWWSGSTLVGSEATWASDGVWYWTSVDGGANLGSYNAFTGVSGTNGPGDTGWNNFSAQSRVPFENAFENPAPYSTTGGAGLVGNSSPDNAYYSNGGSYTNAWADVQIKTVKNVVTLTINKTVISVYTNTTVWTNGYIMLGYEDPFDSVGGPDAAVYYSGLTVVRLAPTAITKQPTNYVAGVGATAAFSVAATFDGSATNTVGQWALNGTPIAGATNTTYSFTVAKGAFGTYTWVVNDGYYVVSSSGATLTPPLPAIVSEPASAVAAITGSTAFSVTAQTFSGVTNYQWYSGSTAISGATNSTVTLTGLTSASFSAAYTVRVSDGVNTITSAPPATLTMATTPTITLPSISGKLFTLKFTSQVGPTYVVGYKTNLLQSAWTPIATNAGTGSPISVTVANATNNAGFYLIKLQ